MIRGNQRTRRNGAHAVLSADFKQKSGQGYISSVSPVLTQLHLANNNCVAFAFCLVELTPECAFDLADLSALNTEVSSITYDCWYLICIWWRALIFF